MNRRKVIIDCDPGVDDAYALCIALKEPSFEVLGIHTVCGNVSVENTTRNARGITKLLKKDVLVYKGSNSPLVFEPIYASDIHGVTGLSGYSFDDDDLGAIAHLSSLEGYAKLLNESKEKVTIIAIGPLTNLGILLKAYPHLKEKIECISIMGGGIKGGNISEAGEFNFYVDPHSADIVFNSGIPLIMAGLDVTEKARFLKEDIDEIKDVEDIGEFLYIVSQDSLKRNFKQGYGHSIAPNDTVAVLCLTNPELFTGKEMYVRVSYESGFTRGMSIADVRVFSDKKPNVLVLSDVNRDEFRRVLKKKIVGE